MSQNVTTVLLSDMPILLHLQDLPQSSQAPGLASSLILPSGRRQQMFISKGYHKVISLSLSSSLLVTFGDAMW